MQDPTANQVLSQQPIVPTQPQQTPTAPSLSSNNQPAIPPLIYAGFWARAAALIIDGLIIIIPISLLVDFLIFQTSFGSNLGLGVIIVWPILFITFTLIFYTIYSLIFVTIKGATVGKLLFNMKIVSEQSEVKIGFKRTLLRELITKIILLGVFPLAIIDGLVSCFDKEKRTLHDRITRTHVIFEKPPSNTKKIMIIVVVSLFLTLTIIYMFIDIPTLLI